MTTLHRIKVKCRKTRLWKGFAHVLMQHPKDQTDYDTIVNEILLDLPSLDEDCITNFKKGALFYFTDQGYLKYLQTITTLTRRWHARIITLHMPKEGLTISMTGLQAIIRPEATQAKMEATHVN